jgi:two-component system, OmpR family, heavy metal sensor histidine kinase CusS
LFRVKIVLLSVLISGTVLVTLGLFFLTTIGKIRMDRIDREIVALGESQLHVWHPKEHWESFDRSLRSIYGPEHWKDLVVQVTDADHRLLYRSPHWPKEFSKASFPEFDRRMAPDLDPRPTPGIPPVQRDGTPDRTGSIPDDLAAADRRQPRRPPPPGEEDGRPPPRRYPPDPIRIKTPYFRTLEAAAGWWRTGILGSQHVTILLGLNLANFYEDTRRLEMAFLFSVPLALLLLAGGGWLVAHRALKPVALITRTAQGITARGLGQRIPATGADAEFRQLIQVINNMLDRLEKSFGQAVRFSADAAHELQTPLTILQGILDDAVQHAPPGTTDQQRYSSLLEEVQRLKNIVRKLLILAQADADRLLLRPGPVDLSALIEMAAEDAGVLGPHLKIEKDILSGVIVPADPDLLRLVIQELTTNAVKYNTADGLIRLRLTVQDNKARFSIANTGGPIPESERERIFDRFYRLDKSRSRNVAGTGLGLSLVREIVRVHQGELHLDAPGSPLISFTLSLPHQAQPSTS